MSKNRIYTKNLLKSESIKILLNFFSKVWFIYDRISRKSYLIRKLLLRFEVSRRLRLESKKNWLISKIFILILFMNLNDFKLISLKFMIRKNEKNLKKYFSDSPKNSIIKNIRWRIWWFFISNRYQNIV